jgi:type IV secretory pathway component VirB8
MMNKSLEKHYFAEATAWDEGLQGMLNKSNKRAWMISFCFMAIAILEAFALIAVMPLKTIEPFVIRVDNNTGYTDVVSKIPATSTALLLGRVLTPTATRVALPVSPKISVIKSDTPFAIMA